MEVLDTFVKKHPDYKNFSRYILINDFIIKDYLHSLDGPAMVGPIDSEIYALNGKVMPKKEWETERLKVIFNNKLDNILND